MTTIQKRHEPRGHWLVGNLRDLRQDMLGFCTRCAREFGDVVFLRMGIRRVALVSHPDFIEQVLVTDSRKFSKHFALQFLRSSLGNGLVLNEGQSWLKQRRLMQPAFARPRIEQYAAAMVKHTEEMLGDWRSGETRDLHADMMRLALRIATTTLVDMRVPADIDALSRANDVLLKDYCYRFESALPIPFWVPTPWNLHVRAAIKQMDAIVHAIIRERRTSWAGRTDLLSLLLEACALDDGSAMSDQQLRDEVLTLLLAGHETTANALAWTGYLLTLHPEVETRLVDEVRHALGERQVTAADLPRLPYTEWVVRESMRLYPPVYAIGRRALEPCVLGTHSIPRGTTVIMGQWIVQRDPRFYDHPEKFLPERWDNNLLGRLPKYAYFPFGGGPRVCIGNTFALMEAALVLATIIRRFRLTLVAGQNVRPWPSVTLRPAAGIKVTCAERLG